MIKSRLIFSLFLVLLCVQVFSQAFSFSVPKAEFDGFKLTVTYDLRNNSQTDMFYVWVEIRKKDGSPVRANSFKGDVGDSISPGNNKKIIWTPEDDAIFLDEEVTVELKGEKYVKSFNKGSMFFKSTLLPGLGQTKISKGRPYWLLGIAAYGALGGGVAMNMKYNSTYDAYLSELEPVTRQDLWDKSQKEKQIAGTCLVAAATIWIGNLVWVSATPNRYKPLQHSRFTMNTVPNNRDLIALLSYSYRF